MVKIKPLLCLTRGGVIANGMPNNTKTIVVIGRASFSQKRTLYCAKAFFFNSVFLDGAVLVTRLFEVWHQFKNIQI